jgi:transposase
MKKMHIVGVDVSKNKLDFHCHGHNSITEPVANDEKGFKQLQKWIKQKLSRDKTEVLIVMEYTGIYTFNFERFLNKQGWSYVKRPALDIKRSTGMQRGKSDKADAQMISKYGWMNRDILKPMRPVSDTLSELQQLMAYRDKLVSDRASHQTRLQELETQMGKHLVSKISESAKYVIEVLSIEIKELETAIKQCIKSDEALQTNYELLTSVRGIGFATAVAVLLATENFERFDDHRKFACYCGVAPFVHESGTSIRGKTRVSHLANKKIKSLLTMAAFTAIKYDTDLKAKYEQKRKEGKPVMSAINIIRAKLIERIFAVIKRQTPYILKAAA